MGLSIGCLNVLRIQQLVIRVTGREPEMRQPEGDTTAFYNLNLEVTSHHCTIFYSSEVSHQVQGTLKGKGLCKAWILGGGNHWAILKAAYHSTHNKNPKTPWPLEDQLLSSSMENCAVESQIRPNVNFRRPGSFVHCCIPGEQRCTKSLLHEWKQNKKTPWSLETQYIL